jgi:hypothetical protein
MDSDPFDECTDMLRQVTKSLQSQAFTRDQQRAAMAPALRVLRDLQNRADVLREEHDQAVEVESRKSSVFAACAVLGLSAEGYVRGLSQLGFKAAVAQLQANLAVLRSMEAERRQQIAETIGAVNAIRQEMGELPLSQNDVRCESGVTRAPKTGLLVLRPKRRGTPARGCRRT